MIILSGTKIWEKYNRINPTADSICFLLYFFFSISGIGSFFSPFIVAPTTILTKLIRLTIPLLPSSIETILNPIINPLYVDCFLFKTITSINIEKIIHIMLGISYIPSPL